MSNHEPFAADSSAAANGSLAVVLQAHQEIASVIKQAAGDLPAAHKNQRLSLGRWFEQPVTPDQVLGRPDALSICLPLLESSKSGVGSLSRWQIEDAVHQSLGRMYSPHPQSLRLFTVLVYPLMLLLFCGLLVVGFSLFLVPEFERMFREIGLTLPPATKFVIDLSHLIQDWGLVIVALLVPAVVVLWVVTRTGSRQTANTTGVGKIDGILAGGRQAVAAWAWHVGLLLQFGLSQADAIAKAGEASCKIQLRRQSAAWADQIRTGYRPFESLAHIGGQRCQLLAEALKLNDSADQSAMLHEVATIYHERGHVVSRWWWEWLAPAIVCFVSILIGLIVTGLFMPLVELISGLTT